MFYFILCKNHCKSDRNSFGNCDRDKDISLSNFYNKIGEKSAHLFLFFWKMFEERWSMAVFHGSFSTAQSPKQIILTPSLEPLSLIFFFLFHWGLVCSKILSFPLTCEKKKNHNPQNENYQILFIMCHLPLDRNCYSLQRNRNASFSPLHFTEKLHSWLILNLLKYPYVLFCKAASQPVRPQLLLVHRVSLYLLQDSGFAIFELQEVSFHFPS